MEQLIALKDKILEFWNKYTSKQKTIIICVACAILVAIVLLAYFMTRPVYTDVATLSGETATTFDTTPVSMNFWGFTPDYFAYSQEFFKTFLSDPKNMENLKSEFFIPLMVDKLINDGTATVEVLDTTSKWFGVTYPEDRQSVVDKIQALVDAGEYPAKLF